MIGAKVSDRQTHGRKLERGRRVRYLYLHLFSEAEKLMHVLLCGRNVPGYNNKQQQKLLFQLRVTNNLLQSYLLETNMKGVLATRKVDNFTSPSLISPLTFLNPVHYLVFKHFFSLSNPSYLRVSVNHIRNAVVINMYRTSSNSLYTDYT